MADVCPMCDTPSSGSAFCEKCGTRLTATPPADVHRTAAPPPPEPGASQQRKRRASSGNRNTLIATGLIGGGLVVALVAVLLTTVLGHGGSTPSAASAPMTSASTHGSDTPSEDPSAPDSSDAAPTEDTASPTSFPDPLGVGFGEQNLPCDSGYIVVLTSTEAPTATGTVRNALERFPNAPDRYYLDPSASCSNLSSLTNKVNLRMVPYMGPFQDPVSACNARMQNADTTTYVIGVSADDTTATYCACSYADSDLPALNSVDDATPSGDDVFWTLELQYMLYDAGYNPGRLVGGAFGSQTTAMVDRLQGAAGLPQNGTMDADTWSTLKSDVC